MGTIDLDNMRADLTSVQIDRQIQALERTCELVNQLIKMAVDSLEDGPERFLIAERLNRLGPTAVGPLEGVLIKTDNSEVRILASLVLLQLGSKAGLHWLLQAVLEDRNYACLIVAHLASNGIYEAVDRIIARLRTSEATDIDLIVAYLAALETLKVEVPPELLQKFEQTSMPWQVRKVVEDLKSH